MATTSTVRIGPTENNVSARVLRNAVTSYFTANTGSDDGNPRIADTIDDVDHSSIVIRNRYFTANVALQDIEGGPTVTGSKEDGVILVFDALRSNPDRPVAGGEGVTFDALHNVHERAESDNICGDLLRLCVGVSIGDLSPEELRGVNHEQEYSRRIMWCLDHGYEYVEADLSYEGQLKGHGVRDKDGFARIVEAIEGTMWSSAVMSKSKTTELRETYITDKAVVQSTILEEKNGDLEGPSKVDDDDDDEEGNPYIPPDNSLLLVQDDSNNGVDYSFGDGMQVNGEGMGAEDIAQLRKDLEVEKAFDEMEMMLREAARIRDASKKGTMSDEERRDRAGEAALKLVNLMTHLGLDDEDDSDGYDSDDSGVADTTKDSNTK